MNEENEVQGQQKEPKLKVPMAAIIAGGIVVLIAIGGGTYFVLNKKSEFKESAASKVAEKILNANCEFNDPDLCKHLNNLKEIKEMSSRSTSTDATGKKYESLWEMEGEDKSHILAIIDGEEFSNDITIGDTRYAKDYSDNKWWKLVDKKQAEELKEEAKIDYQDDFEDTSSEQPAQKTTYKKIGKEACGSLTCFKYQVNDPSQIDTTEYIWFDDKDYMLRKNRSESKEGVTESTYAYSDINISAPSPTKDAKSALDLYNNGKQDDFSF